MNDTWFEFEKYYSEMNLEKLQSFFSEPQNESEQLEFKSGDLSVEGLYKEVCAFANTDGGVIIYGAPTEKKHEKSDIKVAVGELTPAKQGKSGDSLIQKFMTGITPAPTGIKIISIKMEPGYVYIIIIPKSIKPPHQTEGRYYMRAGTMSTPAPHAFIEALFNQRRPVALDFNTKLINNNQSETLFDLCVEVTNKSDFPAREVDGMVIITGKVRDRSAIEGEPQFEATLFETSNRELISTLRFPTAIASDLWMWRRFSNLRLLSDYFYIKVYVWAFDTPAICKIFKATKHEIFRLENADEILVAEEEIRAWKEIS